MVAGIIIGIVSCREGARKKEERDRYMAQFEPCVRQYLASDGFSEDGFSVKSGVLPIDLDDHTYQKYGFEINEEYRPASFHNVRTVLAYKCIDINTGRYTDGEPSYKIDCRVNLIDIATHQWTHEKRLYGGEPPETNEYSGPGYGYDPILGYLRELKVR